jgi:hypothetical protein
MAVKTQRRHKRRHNQHNFERTVRWFWGGAFLVGLLAILLMYVAMG